MEASQICLYVIIRWATALYSHPSCSWNLRASAYSPLRHVSLTIRRLPFSLLKPKTYPCQGHTTPSLEIPQHCRDRPSFRNITNLSMPLLIPGLQEFPSVILITKIFSLKKTTKCSVCLHGLPGLIWLDQTKVGYSCLGVFFKLETQCKIWLWRSRSSWEAGPPTMDGHWPPGSTRSITWPRSWDSFVSWAFSRGCQMCPPWEDQESGMFLSYL